jgi:hypothetical protein
MQGTSKGTGRAAAPRKVQAASSLKSASGSGARAKKTKAVTEVVLARVEAVRLAQRQEGNFDCFATAKQGHCDQGSCLYRSECLDFSQRMR